MYKIGSDLSFWTSQKVPTRIYIDAKIRRIVFFRQTKRRKQLRTQFLFPISIKVFKGFREF